MPYKVFKAGGEFCVHKYVNKKKGRKMGCHSSASKARKQQAALYVAEGKKEIPMADQEIIEETELAENEVSEKDRIEKGYVPWSVTSFEELDSAREASDAAERAYDAMSDFTGIVSNIISSSDTEIEDKPSAITAASTELKTRIDDALVKKTEEKEQPEEEQGVADKIISWMKDFFSKEEEKAQKDESKFMTWKDADGGMRWLAVYSNKFRDEDRPVHEIISEKSHINFIDLVDTKQVVMPELWLWHTSEWKFGVADWLAWDDEGFAISSGSIDEGKEAVAEWISKQANVAVSHGMPNDSVVYDPDDPSIIVQHITKEISPLPMWAAANKRTDFLILGDDNGKEKTEDDMAISDEKKKKLEEDWDAPTSLLENLEKINKDRADKALEEGVDFKETTEEEKTEAESSEAESQEEQEEQQEQSTEQKPEAEKPEAETTDAETEQPEFVTREEVAEVMTPMAQQLEAQGKDLKFIMGALKELVLTDEEKITKAAAETPPASLAAMVSRNMTAIGDDKTEVDGRSSLAKQKPEEAATPGPTGIEFLDDMLSQKQ